MSRTAIAITAKKLPKTDNGWLCAAILYNRRSKTYAAYERRLRRFPYTYDTISMPAMGRKLTTEEALQYFPDFAEITGQPVEAKSMVA